MLNMSLKDSKLKPSPSNPNRTGHITQNWKTSLSSIKALPTSSYSYCHKWRNFCEKQRGFNDWNCDNAAAHSSYFPGIFPVPKNEEKNEKKRYRLANNF